MKRHSGHALAVTASSLLIADALLVAATFGAVLAFTWFDEPRVQQMFMSSPLPFALYLTWFLGVLGTAGAVVAIGVYGFRERWFWRCLIIAAAMWLVFPPIHTIIGLISLILLIGYRKAFPHHLETTAPAP